MTIRTKIRMAWTFDGCDESHNRLDVAANRMRAAGMSREAIDRVLGDKVMSIAEVEIDDAGAIRILSIRPIERCPSVGHGVQCDRQEDHGPDHCGRKIMDGGVAVYSWKDGDRS